jgi:hypothetical protein
MVPIIPNPWPIYPPDEGAPEFRILAAILPGCFYDIFLP